MSRVLLSLLIIASVALASPSVSSGATDPRAATAVLSLIDNDQVEIRYSGVNAKNGTQDDMLAALGFSQTLAAIAAVRAIPAGPWNPDFVHATLDALGLPHLHYRSCWPDDGALVLVPTAPDTAVGAALDAAGKYYDPNRHPREFAEAYWKKLFTYTDDASEHQPAWPGDRPKEALKEGIAKGLPFPTNLGLMTTYQARGVVPFMYVRGQWVLQCFLFICWYVPQCIVQFKPVSEGYGMTGIR